MFKKLFFFILFLFVANNAYGDNSRVSYMQSIDLSRSIFESIPQPMHMQYLSMSEAKSSSKNFIVDLKWRPKRTWSFRSSQLTIGVLKDKKDGILFWNWVCCHK